MAVSAERLKVGRVEPAVGLYLDRNNVIDEVESLDPALFPAVPAERFLLYMRGPEPAPVRSVTPACRRSSAAVIEEP
jgi:hypothetical protein